MQRKEKTKVEALVQLIQDNGGQANWQTIYQKIAAYYPAVKHAKGEALTEMPKLEFAACYTAIATAAGISLPK